MSFEIIDNIFQILVLSGAMTGSVVTACKERSKDFLLLAGGYGCFWMGTLYYVLHLIITGKVPQIFYVAEISWLAAYLFFLSLSLSRRSFRGIFPGIFSIVLTGLTVILILAFRIFGPAWFFCLCFAFTEGTIILRCVESLRLKAENGLFDRLLLAVVWLQIILYIVSEFIRNYTRFNLYFAVDILLTLAMASMLPVLRKEVKR